MWRIYRKISYYVVSDLIWYCIVYNTLNNNSYNSMFSKVWIILPVDCLYYLCWYTVVCSVTTIDMLNLTYCLSLHVCKSLHSLFVRQHNKYDMFWQLKHTYYVYHSWRRLMIYYWSIAFNIWSNMLLKIN